MVEYNGLALYKASMNEQQAVQHLLREKFSEFQQKNSKFSMRAYADKLDINVGALSYILNGKRNVSRTMAEKISSRLLLDPQLRSELLAKFPEKRNLKLSKQSHEPRYLELDAQNFRVAAEWEHFAIMSLLKCTDFESTVPWIAQRLGISLTKTAQVIERLVELGLLARDEQGNLTRSERSYRTTDEVASVSMKQHHKQSLDLAEASLFREKVSQRDFTTLTMVFSPRQMARAKELIRTFQDSFSDELETAEASEVYRLNIQFFPLTKL